MKNILLATVISTSLAWIASADEIKPSILQLPVDCSALLGIDINWKVLDIVMCLWDNLPKTSGIDNWNFKFLTDGQTSQGVGEILEELVWVNLNVGEAFHMSDLFPGFNWVAEVWKQKFEGNDSPTYYSYSEGQYSIAEGKEFDCYASESSLDWGKNISCNTYFPKEALWLKDEDLCFSNTDTWVLTLSGSKRLLEQYPITINDYSCVQIHPNKKA
jgi:hypothetical protein